MVASGEVGPLHKEYHDNEYGFHRDSDEDLFERLVMEIFQAGLSWDLILKRRTFLEEAFQNYDIEKMASWDDERCVSAIDSPGIIRNLAKIKAVVFNARVVLSWRESGLSFNDWIEAQECANLEQWVKKFRATFKFTGPEVVREFLTSLGRLPGAHDETCPAYATIEATKSTRSA